MGKEKRNLNFEVFTQTKNDTAR